MAIITIPAGQTKQIVYSASQTRHPPIHTYLVANLDEINPLYVGPADEDRQQPDLSADLSRSIIAPLQAISLSAEHDWYCFNPAGPGTENDTFPATFTATFGTITPPGPSVQVDVIPNGSYWAPSPAQAAEQIAALGLAKDTSVQATNSQLGTGVAPAVASITSAMAIDVGPGASPFVVFQLTANGRIWGACLSGVTESTSGGSNARVYTLAQIDGGGVPGQGTPLAILEMGAMNQLNVDSDSVYVPFNGVSVVKGTKLYLIINGGSSISGVTITGSVIFFYSIP